MNAGAQRHSLPLEIVAQEFHPHNYQSLPIGCGDIRLPENNEAHGEEYLRVFGARYAIELMAITAMVLTDPSYDPGKHVHEIEEIHEVLQAADLLPHDHHDCKFIMGSIAICQTISRLDERMVANASDINEELDRTTAKAIAGVQTFLLDSGYVAIAEAILAHRERAGHRLTKLRGTQHTPTGVVVNKHTGLMKRPIPDHELDPDHSLYWVDEHAAQTISEALGRHFGKDTLDPAAFMAVFAMFTAATGKLVTPKGREDEFALHIID